nr:peptidoglycan-binding protein [Sedimentibacter sp.]
MDQMYIITKNNYNYNYNYTYIPGYEFPSNVIVTIPDEITVHLGAPSEEAENVTLPFIDYIKNVASSELYPTWPEDALKANVYAIVSVAMNRVFTEWYRSRGYVFDITNSTQYDQSFVHNRGIFENISEIVDEQFNDYIVKRGRLEPLFAQYCDGRTSQCPGMYQWGSVDLANQGYTPLEILKYYYGDDISLVIDAPIGAIAETYPQTPLQRGDSDFYVLRFQHSLNRISDNYPGIPRIRILDGYFDETTEAAVIAFQRVFNLSVTGIVDRATWNKIRNVYISVSRLNELTSEGLLLSDIDELYSGLILEGDILPRVDLLQYFLNLMSAYYGTIPSVEYTGVFDPQTRVSLMEFQKNLGLNPTGIVDNKTWSLLFQNILGILLTLPNSEIFLPNLRFPGTNYQIGLGSEYPGIVIVQELLSYISTVIPDINYSNPNGIFDDATERAIIEFQRLYGLEANGKVDEATWNKLMEVYQSLRYRNV